MRSLTPVYIAHPFSTYGDLRSNIEKQKTICSFYNTDIFLPISPILNFNGWLPADMESYERVMVVCNNLLLLCKEAHFWGEWEKSKGCQMEMGWCKENNILVRVFKSIDDLKKVQQDIVYERFMEASKMSIWTHDPLQKHTEGDKNEQN